MLGHILILDDNPTDVKIAVNALERLGFACHGFSDQNSALHFLNDHSVRLIFLDLQMPKVSGYDLIPVFKKHPMSRDALITIISGKNQTEDVRRAIELGASDYVVKPMDPLVLQEKVRKLTDKNEDFSGVPVPAEAFQASRFMLNLKVLALSEFGIKLESAHEVKPGDTIEIGGLPLDVAGKERILLRCLSSDARPADRLYTLQFTFVGLGEAARQSLRKYCRQLWVQAKGRAG